MKINYEQKYKDALERARDMMSYKEVRRKDMESLFPELKESDGERTRKQIISFLKEFEYDHYRSLDFSSWIAWLEKQGDNANKVEPKFKDGQWIVFNGLTLYINEVVKGYYRTISIGGIPNSYDWNIDNAARLWTIQDAKDGDVLVASDNSIFIFARVDDYGCIHHIALANDGVLKINPRLISAWESVKGVKPATKEQHDLLFAKMHEAGYEWNADEKVVNMEKGK